MFHPTLTQIKPPLITTNPPWFTDKIDLGGIWAAVVLFPGHLGDGCCVIWMIFHIYIFSFYMDDSIISYIYIMYIYNILCIYIYYVYI
jgi:hypothetical protein